jgi:hypothetical protein
VAVTAQLVWTNRLISDVGFRHDSSLRGIVDLTISSGQDGGKGGGKEGGYLYDPIVIVWSTSSASSSDELRIDVAIDGQDEVAIGSLLNGSPLSSPKVSKIKCSINEHHCLPTVGNIMAMTKGSPSITVYFNEETDTPNLSSSQLLLAALTINPPLMGPAVGTWTNEKTLSIAVDQGYLQDIVGAHTRGEVIEVSIRLFSENSDGGVATEVATGSDKDAGAVTDSDSNDAGNIDITAADTADADSNDNNDALDTQYCFAEYSNSDSSDGKELSNDLEKKCKKRRKREEPEGKRKRNKVVIRPTEHGITRIFAVNATSLSVVSNVIEYDVRVCGGQLVPPLVLRRQEVVTSSAGGMVVRVRL